MHTKEEREGILWEFHRSDLSAPPPAGACRFSRTKTTCMLGSSWRRRARWSSSTGPQHRLARAFAHQARRDAARVPARARRARRLEAFAGDAKTDERGAMVIVKTALGIPDTLLAVADRPPEIEAARSPAAQRDFLTCENTRSKNRLRSILLESCPEFEAQADLSGAATLKLMAVGGRGRYPRPRRRLSGRSRAAAGAPKWRR